ncbi:hypothetical protein KIN20_037548 [Parelaphostrongylus tenuis]|uniref:Uncharacterized protein n=1 Tax=Parelaphostrongylus tenuis TaxID=148309 RepID=A0AAD5WMK1_PARTN|nr:hypothetical protein KIN20_037548 [Parelaphostrongylus tenuis]
MDSGGMMSGKGQLCLNKRPGTPALCKPLGRIYAHIAHDECQGQLSECLKRKNSKE